MTRRVVFLLLALAVAVLLPRSEARAAGPIVVEAVTPSPSQLRIVDGNRGVPVAFSVSLSGGRGPYTVRWTTDRGVLCENCNPLQVTSTQLRAAGDSFYAFFTVTDADGQKATWKGTDGVPRPEFSVGIGPNGLTSSPDRFPSVPGAAGSPTAAPPVAARTPPTGTGAAPASPPAGTVARFSGASGQVEVRDAGCDDEDCWRLVKSDTVLTVGMHVRTQDQSSAVIAFEDTSTFVMKPESEVVITAPPAKITSLQLLLGNIRVNVGKILTGGSMDVEMSQAVAGIKGTTFIVSERNGVSSLQVIEGSVELTSRANGQKATVTGGSSVEATKNGLGKLQTFDVQQVTAEWDAVQKQALAGKPGKAGWAAFGAGSTAMLAGGAVFLAVVIAGVWVVLRRRTR